MCGPDIDQDRVTDMGEAQQQHPKIVSELPLLLALATLWGASYTFLKVAVATIPPVTLIAGRTLIAGLLLVAIMVVKVKGQFVWHKHDDTDDFFLVLKGVLDIHLRDRIVTLGPGQMYVVPKGVEHRPVAREEVHMLLIEPTGTPNTGDAATAAPRATV